MTKDLAQNKLYTYFNIGDAKTLVNLKHQYSKFTTNCSYTPLSENCCDFFASLVLSFSQITRLLTEIVAFAYSLLELTKILMKSPNF